MQTLGTSSETKVRSEEVPSDQVGLEVKVQSVASPLQQGLTSHFSWPETPCRMAVAHFAPGAGLLPAFFSRKKGSTLPPRKGKVGSKLAIWGRCPREKRFLKTQDLQDASRHSG